MKTLLVTGASGLIGREITGVLLEKGYNVIATDKVVSPYVGKPNFSFIQCDITDKAKITNVIDGSKIDALIHLACSVDNDFPTMVTEQEMEISKNADKYIYKAAIAANVNDIILLSTTQIYPLAKNREPISEGSAERPSTNYAKLKMDSEKAFVASLKKTGTKAIVMRTAPIYTRDYIQNLHARIYDNKDGVAFLYAEGGYGFTFCSLYNLIDFVCGILLQDGSKQYQGVYNVCDSRPINAKEIVEFERKVHHLGAVIQRSYAADTVKATIFAASKAAKADYLYVDPATLTSNTSFSNLKAQRISTFRWNLDNTK